MKYAFGKYSITKTDEAKILQRFNAFSEALSRKKKRKTIHITLVTPEGIVQNTHSGIANEEVTMEAFFLSTK